LKKSLQKGSKYLLALSMVAFLSACGTDGNDGVNSVEDGTSQLVSGTVVDDVSSEVMLAYVKAGITESAVNAFETKAVKISYNTVNQDGKPLLASGLLVIPTPTDEYKDYLASVGKSFSVSMICDNHGTIFLNSEAPTNVEKRNGVPDYPLSVLMSGYAGFAAIYPDYIGFGDSNATVHPYILKNAAARASLDMIKASMKYMENNGIVLNHQLYITGYSEGGYNAMALSQSVESELTNVNLMGIAPMAGPYNVVDLADVEINATRRMPYPAFLADLSYSYSIYYDDFNLSEVAVPAPIQFETAFNGNYDTVPIHIVLGLGAVDENGTVTDYGFYTHTANELFKQTFIDDYTTNLNSVARNRFEENNVDNWIPRTRVNLIQCLDDDIIPFSESNHTYNKFKENGVDVTLTGIPTFLLKQQQDATHPFIHANCGPEAYGAAVIWFDAIRNGDIQ
jgi:predicted esterase